MVSTTKISVTGLGYIGTPHALIFGSCGYDVWGFDTNNEILEMLQNGRLPIQEGGLDALLKTCRELGNVRFTADIAEAILSSTIHFFCVGTPPREDGSADTKYIDAAVQATARVLKDNEASRQVPDLFVIKSTVPVRTNERLYALVREMGLTKFDIISCPEFMAESTALRDLNNPHKIMFGVDSSRPHARYAVETLTEVYDPFMHNDKNKLIIGDPRSVELSKYACNGALGVRISYANDIAVLCDEEEAHYPTVWAAMIRDPRIGAQFLKPGPGYGGMCFPKDLRELLSLGERNNLDLSVVRGAVERNARQKLVGAYKVLAHFDGDLQGRTIGIWGTSFKANTDDCRESAAVDTINLLAQHGAKEFTVYDVLAEARRKFEMELGKVACPVKLCSSARDAAQADAVVLLTESKQYQGLDLLTELGPKVQFFADMRNHLTERQISTLAARGITYRGIGRYNT